MKSEIVNLIIDEFSNEIKEYLGNSFVFKLIPSIIEIADKVEKIPHEYKVKDFAISFNQDIDYHVENKLKNSHHSLLIHIDKYKILRICTPFLKKESFGVCLIKSSEMDDLQELIDLKLGNTKNKLKSFPIIGIDFKSIEKETIEFLLNEDFRKYCKNNYISLKRGLVFEGKPGCGKSLCLKHLKQKCLENNIKFVSFKSVDHFLDNIDGYYVEGKKLFVFEDFDAMLRERTETNNSPNEIINTILNLLDGINPIDDVVSIFTTNHVKILDSAFLRPGRIEKVISFKLPNSEQCLEFLKAYLNEEDSFCETLLEGLNQYLTDLSYAMLKGICDEINIYKFSGKEISMPNAIKLALLKVQSANNQKENKKTSSYVL